MKNPFYYMRTAVSKPIFMGHLPSHYVTLPLLPGSLLAGPTLASILCPGQCNLNNNWCAIPWELRWSALPQPHFLPHPCPQSQAECLGHPPVFATLNWMSMFPKSICVLLEYLKLKIIHHWSKNSVFRRDICQYVLLNTFQMVFMQFCYFWLFLFVFEL